MFSKAIKLDFSPDPEPKTRVGALVKSALDFLKETFFYPVESFYHTYTERIKRSYAFAKMGWLNYDFDSAFLYEVMIFKMKRIHKTLKNGHAIQEKENMDALKEAIKICERLYNGRYEDKYYKEIDKKFGKIKSECIPSENGLTEWKMSRTKVKTKKQREKEREALRQLIINSDKDRRADIDRLAEILKNHEPSWWD